MQYWNGFTRVLVNIVQTLNVTQTYFDEDEPWSGILDAAEFAIFSTIDRLKVYGPFQLVFGRDMIILIKQNVDWERIHQQNQTKINKDNIRKI